jgi:diguanylate cyclase (GGDEF)-like protein
VNDIDPLLPAAPVAEPLAPQVPSVPRLDSLGRIPGFPVKSALVALMLVSLVPALLIAAWLLYDDYHEREAAVYRETELQARALMSSVDRELARIDSTARLLAASPLLQRNDLAQFDALLRTAPVPELMRAFLLIDRNGQQRLNAGLPLGTPLGRTSDLTQLRRVFDTGQPVLFDLIPAAIDGSPIIVYAVPVWLDGQVAYSLNAGIPSSRLSAILASHPLPAGWVAALTDSRGILVARSRDPVRFIGQPVSTPLQESLLTGSNSGLVESTTKDGVPVISAFVKSQMTNLRVVVGAPKSMLASQVTYGVLTYALLAIVVIGIALVAAVLMATSMTHAIASLIGPALALGSGRPADFAPTRLREANALGYAIRQASRMIDEARHQAHHDALTGLCNRVLFDELLTHQLHVAVRAEHPLAILAIDLDNFKQVNDTHGHAAGDLVLKIAAERIHAHVRASDVVSRRGGDEFMALLIDGGHDVAHRAAGAIVAALSAPYPDVLPSVTASIGIAVFEGGAPDGEALLKRGDAALYAAKHAGKARFVDLDGAPS